MLTRFITPAPFILCLVLAVSMPARLSAAPDPTPYAGWQHRNIKALAQRQIDDLLNGRGMSLALAAELNGYPGPRHVLDHAGQLGLSQDQAAKTLDLFRSMKEEAIPIGREVVRLEAALDQMFVSATASERVLEELLSGIAAANKRLRFVHLRYHLEQRKLLSEAQLDSYRRLRGYGARDARPAIDHGDHRP